MATAYKHKVLGSTKQLISFTYQRTHEIREQLEDLTSEEEMWERVDQERRDSITPLTTVHLRNRLREILEIVTKLQNEKKAMEELRGSLDPCTNCEGHGEVRFQIDPMEGSRSRKCEKCDGTGDRIPR